MSYGGRHTSSSPSHIALLHNHLDLVVGQGVLEAVADEEDQRQALAQLVGAGGRVRRKLARQLVLREEWGRNCEECEREKDKKLRK